MKKNIILACLSVLLLGIVASCVKTTPIPNFNTISVTFVNAGPKYVTGDLTVNGKDSIQFNYQVTSPTRMQYVYLLKNGGVISTDTLKTGTKLSFTGLKKLVADTTNGPFTYAVVARDTTGLYLGSGPVVTVTTSTDFKYFINRTLFVPDTTAKTNPCYYNSATGTPYNYTSAGTANSVGIDFGYYYSTDSIYVKKVKTAIGHSIYALNYTPVPSQISFYDISTWTKNATLFKLSATPTFASVLSVGGIKAGAATNLKTGAVGSLPIYTPNLPSTSTGNDSFAALAAGNVIWFKTAAGKYGVIQIDYINQNSAAHGTFITIDVKMQP